MKLRNKKTGEIGYPYFQNWKEITCVIVDENAIQIAEYTSLAELNEEWEDYEEPKEDGLDNIIVLAEAYSNSNSERYPKEIVEKLKAVKRLKDKGFRFSGWTIDDGLRISICTNTDEDDIYDEDKRRIKPDLDLLFSGGEE